MVLNLSLVILDATIHEILKKMRLLNICHIGNGVAHIMVLSLSESDFCAELRCLAHKPRRLIEAPHYNL